jgi:hypothetical protein
VNSNTESSRIDHSKYITGTKKYHTVIINKKSIERDKIRNINKMLKNHLIYDIVYSI